MRLDRRGFKKIIGVYIYISSNIEIVGDDLKCVRLNPAKVRNELYGLSKRARGLLDCSTGLPGQLIIPVDAHMIGSSTVLILGDLVFPLRPIVFRAAPVIAKAVPSDEASECRGCRKRGETYDMVKRHL